MMVMMFDKEHNVAKVMKVDLYSRESTKNAVTQPQGSAMI
jgi:hypothetical protein